tara:strand:- start:242 stop:799 length:558 start_codon:yes stop_codon:yes gene_type:complete
MDRKSYGGMSGRKPKTVEWLKAKAKAQGHKGYSKMRKEELRTLVKSGANPNTKEAKTKQRANAADISKRIKGIPAPHIMTIKRGGASGAVSAMAYPPPRSAVPGGGDRPHFTKEARRPTTYTPAAVVAPGKDTGSHPNATTPKGATEKKKRKRKVKGGGKKGKDGKMRANDATISASIRSIPAPP